MTHRFTLTPSEYQDIRDEYGGFCRKCGAEAWNVEPDARRYVCEDCGARAVYGIEELLNMSLVDLDEDADGGDL